MYPDPRIRISDLRILILLFLSLADKMLTKSFFAYYFLKVHLVIYTVFMDKTSKISLKIVVESSFFGLFLLVDGKIRIHSTGACAHCGLLK
jgi:hypothetical protein